MADLDRQHLQNILQRARESEYKYQNDPGAAWAFDRLVYVVSSLLDTPYPQFAGVRIVSDPSVPMGEIRIRATTDQEPA